MSYRSVVLNGTGNSTKIIDIEHMRACAYVSYLPKAEQCDFVKNSVECAGSLNYINYVEIIYCNINTEHTFVFSFVCFLLFLWCCYLFIMLGIAADKFFCPALTVIAKFLKLSENLAGVTFVAFGNGSTDIFTALVSPDGLSDLIFSELIGAAIFVLAIIVGAILIVQPFHIDFKSFLRDWLFLVVGLLYINFIIYDNSTFSFIEAFGIISIYIIYLCTVVGEHLYWRYSAKKTKRLINDITHSTEEINDTKVHELNLKLIRIREVSDIVIRSKENFISMTDEDIKLKGSSNFSGFTANTNIFQQFLLSIIPVDIVLFKKVSVIKKIFYILLVPAKLILILLIPVVDYTEENHGWSKLLNMLHCILLPLLILESLEELFNDIEGLPVAVIGLVIGIILAIVVFFTSTTAKPPKYHIIFAVGTFLGSISAIQIIATEVISLLTVLGIVSKLSFSFLGFSMLAWGNSIGDLISNVALARRGYSKMGFSACFGGPLFNTLIGFGSVYIKKLIDTKNDPITAEKGTLGVFCIFMIISLLFFILILFSCLKFQTNRKMGIILIIIYIIFLVICIFVEFKIIEM